MIRRIHGGLAPAASLAALLCAGISQASEPGGPLLPNGQRTLAFDATEGTWMSVDVHPRGDALVFDLLGDLYMLPVTGGTARLLLGGVAFDSQPVFSPDGSRIAFVSDRSGSDNLWVANADGSGLRQLSRDAGLETFSSPAWSRDGQSVFVSRKEKRRDEFGLWLYDLAGGRGVRLEEPTQPAGEILDAAPAPDGRTVYYSARSRAAATLFFTPNWDVVRRDLRSGAIEPVVTAPGGALRPVLSPDGSRLVYGTRFDGQTGLRTRDLVTGEDRWLLYPIDDDAQGDTVSRGLLPGFAFLPSGDALVIGYGGKLRRVELASARVDDIPFTAEVRLDLGPSLARDVPIDTGPVRARLIQGPAQSPDGTQVAFSAFAHLYVADLAGGAPRRLTDGDEPAFQPAWSPDGRSIAYVTWTAAGGGQVWTTRPGGKPRPLAPAGAFYSDPVFSGDGQYVFALRSSNHERMQLQEEVSPNRFSDLVRIPAGGGDPVVVAHAGTGARRPFVTNEPGRVYYTTPEGVASVRADAAHGEGADLRKHLRVDGLHPWTSPGRPVPLDEGVLSPDGRWLLTTMANQLYAVAVPPAGPETPVVDLTAEPQRQNLPISRLGADYFGWADGGRTVTWALGSTFFRQAFGVAGPHGDVQQFEFRIEAERDVPRGSLLLRGATVITMRGEEVLPDADILVVDDRIAGIGPRGTLGAAADRAETLDLAGRFVVPGFIDTHAHWYELRRDVLDLQNWSFLASLAFGVTAGLDVQAMDQDAFAYQDLIDAGRTLGPRAFTVGQGMFANNRIPSREDVDRLLERYRDHYRTPNVKSYVIGNRLQRQWVVASAAERGLLPTTEGNGDLKLDLTHAIDGFHGNEHAMPAGRLYDDVVKLYAATRIAYTPTLMISGLPSPLKNRYLVEQVPHDDPKVRRFMPHFVIDARSSPLQWVRPDQWQSGIRHAEGAASILSAGGRVGIGSHAEFQGPVYHWEMWALAEGGVAPHDVLRAATVHGSEILGRAGELGSIEPGKYADLVILGENPLDDIRNTASIRQVMKNGRLYDAGTLDEVWPRQRTLPPQWFWNLGPPTGPDATDLDLGGDSGRATTR